MLDRFVNKVFCGDALRLLRALPNASVDAVVTDAMYGTSKDCQYDWGADPAKGDPAKHWDYHEPIYQECRRMLKPGGVLAWGQGAKFGRYYHDWFGGYRLWTLTRFRLKGMAATGHVWVVQTKEQQPIEFPHRDSLVIFEEIGPLRKAHPCIKPPEELAFLIETLTKPGQIVVDCFCGLGSTLIAAESLGRKWIGCDLSRRYCQITMKRLVALKTRPRSSCADTSAANYRSDEGFPIPQSDQHKIDPASRLAFPDARHPPAISLPHHQVAETGKNRWQPHARGRKRDDFFTPAYALDPLLPYLPLNAVIWEAAWGTGELAGHLAEAGYTVVGGPEIDMLSDCPDEWDVLITNPPYSLKSAGLSRAYALGKPFALLLPINALAGKQRVGLYRDKGIQLLIPNKRINFSNAEIPLEMSAATFPTAWFCWGLNLPHELNFVDANW